MSLRAIQEEREATVEAAIKRRIAEAVAAEREECAKVVEGHWSHRHSIYGEQIAAAIRARGEKK